MLSDAMIGEKSRLRSMILVKTCYWLVSTVILSGTRRLPTISSCPDSDAGIRRGLERSWLALVQKWTLWRMRIRDWRSAETHAGRSVRIVVVGTRQLWHGPLRSRPRIPLADGERQPDLSPTRGFRNHLPPS